MSPQLIRAAIVGLASASIPGLLIVGAELAGLGSWGIVSLGAAALVMLAGGAALLAIPFKRVRAGAAQIIAFSAIFVLSSIAFLIASGEARDTAFARLAERSEPVITAIKQYEATRGRPPANLDELIPSYLAEVPSTGMLAYPNYEYKAFPPEAAKKLHWYDLGSRNGRSFAGLRSYVDGDPEHAILVITTDQAGRILQVDADRLPTPLEENKFDPELWANQAQRMTMVRDLVATLDPVGQPFTKVANVLGSPDGTRTLLNAEWELRVPCSLGILNWDVFFYWPRETYPDYIYGGSVERIGKWAYVHE